MRKPLIFILLFIVISGCLFSQADPAAPYPGRRPVYSFFSDIGQINTLTKDGYSVSVVIILAYNQNDTVTLNELSGKLNELRDFVRQYFTGKYADELQPENEERLKRDIMETLNTRFLDQGRVRMILFSRLDVTEVL